MYILYGELIEQNTQGTFIPQERVDILTIAIGTQECLVMCALLLGVWVLRRTTKDVHSLS